MSKRKQKGTQMTAKEFIDAVESRLPAPKPTDAEYRFLARVYSMSMPVDEAISSIMTARNFNRSERKSIATLVGATITSTMIEGDKIVIRGKRIGDRREKAIAQLNIATSRLYDEDGMFFEEAH